MLAPFMCMYCVYLLYVKYVPVESKADSVVVEKLVEIQLPPDSATIRVIGRDENGSRTELAGYR